MNIVRLHVDGFGHFAGRDFGPFSSPVTVIEGLNEAGKTTLLAFVRTVLFGWPAHKRAEHYPPLHGGRHGGTIELIADDGGHYIVDRWEDTHGPHLLITLPDGAQTSDNHVLNRLLGSASRAMFEEVFAFDVDVLRGLKETASGDIFQAGTGARALPRALTAIEKARSALFKKGGELQTVAVLLRQLAAVQRDLAEVEDQAAEYGQLTLHSAQLDGQIATSEASAQALDTQYQHVVRMRKGWDAWVVAAQLQSELAALPDVANFPDDGVARLTAAEAARDAAVDAVNGAAAQVERWRAEVARDIPDEPLLAESATISALKDQLSWYKDRADTLPRRRAETESAAADLGRALRDLGPGWDAPRVRAFDSSIAVQHEVQQHQMILAAAAQSVVATSTEEQRATRAVAQAAESAEAATSELEALPKPAYDRTSLRERREALRACRARSAEYVRAQSEVSSLEYQSASLTAPTVATATKRPLILRSLATGGLMLAALVVLAVGANSTIAGAIATTGVELLLFAGIVLAWRRTRPVPTEVPQQHPLFGQLNDARQREHDALDGLLSAASLFGLRAPSAVELDAIDARLEATADALTTYEAASQAAATAEAARRRASAEHEQAVQAAFAAREGEMSLAAAWHAWLEAHTLDSGLQPDLVALLLQKVEQTRILANNLDGPGGKRHREQAIADDIASYQDRVDDLGRHLAITIPTDTPAAVIAAVSDLATRQTVAAKAAEVRNRAQSEARRAEDHLGQQTRALDTTLARIDSLLAAARVDDAEAFRALASALTDRRRIEAALSQCETQLATLSGPGAARDRFTADLAATTLPDLEQRVGSLAEAVDAARSSRDDLRDQRARAEQRLSQLIDGAHTSELLALRESLVDQLRSAAQRWSELTIAKSVLERARHRWEEDRQPAVVRDAGETFASITGGRYTRIIPQLDADGLKVVEAGSDKQKDAARLSRGAQEQLYLALRFGLIRQFGEREVRLPVIVDEVLVNFDARRGERVAQAFSQLASTNQVLVFTCHSWVSAMFQRTADCQVVSLGQESAPTATATSARLFAEIS